MVDLDFSIQGDKTAIIIFAVALVISALLTRK
jgi:hypothetical protein